MFLKLFIWIYLTYFMLYMLWMRAVCVCRLLALRIHISKPCYIGLLEIGGYEMTLRGEMNVKV